jgi:AcrR family transcriptional regulator
MMAAAYAIRGGMSSSRYGVYHEVMARPYQLKQRAERQDQTRQRIVEAAIELHQTIGPAATTVTDVAERAGVGRVTVYRHFPSELALAQACSGHYFEGHPAPDTERWLAIPDADERLRAALEETYAYHRTTEAMMTHVLADARDHEVMKPYHAYWQQAVEVLLAPWKARGRRRAQLRAGIALALSFDTWRTLVRDQGLTDDQAIDLVQRLCADAGWPHRLSTMRRAS